MLRSRSQAEQFVIAVEVGSGAAFEGKNRVCEWDELDPDVPLLLPQAPHGRTFLPNHPSADLSVMAWLLAPWCSDFSLRSLASWLKLELPLDDYGGAGGGRGGSALVQATRQLYLTLRAHLEAAGLWVLYRRVEWPLGHVLRRMERVGIPVVGGTVDLGAEKKETRHRWQGWPARWTSLTGRVHPLWIQANAITGRISARDPPLQSLPRRLRHSVAAPSRRVLVAADLSGADFRAACAMSGDPALREMFEQGDDPYTVIGKGAAPEGRGNERVIGKGIALAALYDAMVRTMAAELGLSLKAVQNALTQYRALFPRLWQWRDELLERFHAGQDLRNPFGEKEVLIDRRDVARLPHFPVVAATWSCASGKDESIWRGVITGSRSGCQCRIANQLHAVGWSPPRVIRYYIIQF